MHKDWKTDYRLRRDIVMGAHDSRVVMRGKWGCTRSGTKTGGAHLAELLWGCSCRYMLLEGMRVVLAHLR